MANPVLNVNRFNRDAQYAEMMLLSGGEAATVNGTLQITGVLALFMLASAVYVWMKYTAGNTALALQLTGIGAIAGLVLGLIIAFTGLSPRLSNMKYLMPFYAICQGLFLGGISAEFETAYPGIVSMAITGTFAALFSMLLLYTNRVIRYSNTLAKVLFISTLSVAGIYLVNFIGSFFGLSVPVINSASPAGIIFSIIVVVVAALNLVVDFHFIESAAERHFPKVYEWYGAFGLLVTIIWLYVEILKLLAKIQGNRRG